MATAINEQTTSSSVGLLIVFADLVSNEQKDEILIYLQKALKRIDTNRFNQISELCNQLINIDEFQSGLFDMFLFLIIRIIIIVSNRCSISSN